MNISIQVLSEHAFSFIQHKLPRSTIAGHMVNTVNVPGGAEVKNPPAYAGDTRDTD